MNVDQNPLPRETSYPFDIPGALAALESGRKPVVAVVGDYCLDKYLFIDARLEEPSVETGLAAIVPAAPGKSPLRRT